MPHSVLSKKTVFSNSLIVFKIKTISAVVMLQIFNILKSFRTKIALFLFIDIQKFEWDFLLSLSSTGYHYGA